MKFLDIFANECCQPFVLVHYRRCLEQLDQHNCHRDPRLPGSVRTEAEGQHRTRSCISVMILFAIFGAGKDEF